MKPCRFSQAPSPLAPGKPSKGKESSLRTPARGDPCGKHLQEDLRQEQADNNKDPAGKNAALKSMIDDYNATCGTNHRIFEFDLSCQDVHERINDQQWPNAAYPATQKINISLGSVLLAECYALKTTLANARDGQRRTAQARANLAVARMVPELQLGKNILTIAHHHLGHPERAAYYFNQSLLEVPTRRNDDGVTPTTRRAA